MIMPDESDFADFEPDDAYSAEGTIDVGQLAARLHEDRVALNWLNGRSDTPADAVQWHELTDEDRAVAVSITEHLAADTSDVDTAAALHEASAYFTGAAAWEDLHADAQNVGVALVQLTLDRLEMEGLR